MRPDHGTDSKHLLVVGERNKSRGMAMPHQEQKRLYEEPEKSIKEIHPYETPEIIAMPIIAGSEDYMK